MTDPFPEGFIVAQPLSIFSMPGRLQEVKVPPKFHCLPACNRNRHGLFRPKHVTSEPLVLMSLDSIQLNHYAPNCCACHLQIDLLGDIPFRLLGDLVGEDRYCDHGRVGCTNKLVEL